MNAATLTVKTANPAEAAEYLLTLRSETLRHNYKLDYITMQLRSILTIFLSLMLLSTPQPSYAQIAKDGKAVTAPNIGSKNGFSASLWLTEHKEFFRDFAKGGKMQFYATGYVRRNVPVFITFFITGPGLDAAGAADVTADITIRKPDGTIYFQTKDAPCWSGNFPYAATSTQVGDAKVELRIEAKDPAGKYTMEATVHDKTKKVDLLLKKGFEVVQ